MDVETIFEKADNLFNFVGTNHLMLDANSFENEDDVPMFDGYKVWSMKREKEKIVLYLEQDEYLFEMELDKNFIKNHEFENELIWLLREFFFYFIGSDEENAFPDTQFYLDM